MFDVLYIPCYLISLCAVTWDKDYMVARNAPVQSGKTARSYKCLGERNDEM